MDFDVAVHIATLAAIIIALRKDILLTLRTKRLWPMIVVSAIPVALVGVLLSDESLALLQSPLPVAISLIVWGIALAVTDAAARHHDRLPSLSVMPWRQAMFMGAAQMISLIPGTSRSGITMTAGMAGGLDRDAAARFSFIMAIPAIAGAGLLEALKVYKHGLTTPPVTIAVGAIAALIFGILSLQLLLVTTKKVGFKWFALYRIILGLVIIFWLV